MTKMPKPGDEVKWGTPQGETQGTVEKVVTSTMKVKGHRQGHQGPSAGDGQEQQSGKTAVHKPEELKKN